MTNHYDDLKIQRSLAYDIMGYACSRGLPILDVFDVGVASVNDRKLKDAFMSMRKGVREGLSLSDAMKQSGFPFEDYEIKEMDEGEERGEVDVRLQGLAKKLNPDSKSLY